MSNLWLNVRIFNWFIQSSRERWWKIKISKTKYHSSNGWPQGYFSVYQFLDYIK